MIAWSIRLLLAAAVVAALVAGWRGGAAVASDLAAGPRMVAGADSSPSGPMGPALVDRIRRDLVSVNGLRDERLRGRRVGVVVLRSVDFERSAGGVVARGSIDDLGGPRTLNAVIDAFDASRRYLASGSSPIASAEGTASFSVAMEDRDDFSSFSVRFLDAGMTELETRRPDAPMRAAAPLLADDMLRPGDLGEAAQRLADLGFGRAGRAGDDEVVFHRVERFRASRGLKGPAVVTIGDLLALRALTTGVAPGVDLSGY